MSMELELLNRKQQQAYERWCQVASENKALREEMIDLQKAIESKECQQGEAMKALVDAQRQLKKALRDKP